MHIPPKEVEVVLVFVVDGGEGDRDKEARERAAVVDASLLKEVRISVCEDREDVQRTSTSFTSVAESSSCLSCRPQTTMMFSWNRCWMLS